LSALVNAVVHACNTRVSHPTQRLDATFLPATRFHPAAGAGRSCSVLDRQFGNSVRLTFDTGELSVIRKASAAWYGTGRGGKGNLSSDSGALADIPYSFSTRFEGEKGTNPEELIAAAHAGWFTMALAFRLQAAGYTATELHTEAAVNLEKDAEGFSISRSAPTLRASVPNLDQDRFDQLARDAERNCPVSRVLKTEITLDAQLVV
jgi:lipoyl-dependent peroxiredoxin